MSKRILLQAIGILLFLLPPSEGWPTTGGPTSIEVLGYDPVDRKVFFMAVDGSEAGTVPIVHYFSLASNSPTRVVQVRSWYEKIGPNDHEAFEEQLERLRLRLSALKPLEQSAVSTKAEIQYIDQFQVEEGLRPVARYKVHFNLSYGSLRAELDATAYCSDRAELIGAFQVPEEPYVLAVLSYIGNPVEFCYETETAVLLSAHL